VRSCHGTHGKREHDAAHCQQTLDACGLFVEKRSACWQCSPRRYVGVNKTPSASVKVVDMWSIADRMVKAVSDVTVGTVIVLVHIALADRNKRRTALVRN
jgi:hypothetical protein